MMRGGNPAGKQLMVLWSTKDNPLVEVNGHPWKPIGRPGFDEDGGIAMDGMVAAWWYDGKELIEPLVLEEGRILVVSRTIQVAIPKAVLLHPTPKMNFLWD